MKRDLRFVLITLLFVASLSIISFGQGTTGSMEITVKDAAGAVVPNVSVTINGTTNGFHRTATTDDSGYLKIIQVPPGMYTVEAAATSGFVAKKIEQISVGLEKTTSVSIDMTTQATATVDVNAEDTTGLDLTDTKVQTTFTAAVADLLPKGLNFNSIIKFAPAARAESRSGQFQIDGASAAENVFVIDGQEVSDTLTGALDRNSNLPFSLIQETQVKSSGFEAEFGGATGGVINVVTKSGGNDFHGELGVTLRNSRFEPIPGSALRSPGSSAVPEYYPGRRDHFHETNSTATLLGPVWRNHVWFSVAYAPQKFTRNRVLNYTDKTTRVPIGQTDKFHATVKNEKVFGRLDAQPFSKLHLFSTYQWNPEIDTGATPGYSSELVAFDPNYNRYQLICQAAAGPPNSPPVPGSTFCGGPFLDQTGGRLNSLNFNAGGSYVVTNNLVASSRISHYFLNNRLGTYGGGNIGIPTVNCDPRTALPFFPQFPASTGCNPNGANGNGVKASTLSLFDYNIRDQVDADATYSFSLVGRHELKGGFQQNNTKNSVDEETNDIINIKWGVFANQQHTTFLTQATSVELPAAPGATGFGKLTAYSVRASSRSTNRALYFQDKWQPTSRLTFNLGVRGEHENVPSFFPGIAPLDFGWGQKIAPRLGAAYSLTSDGKTKISAFYGLFYDRFKLTLPRREFGGETYHFLYFDLFPTDNLQNLNRDTITGGHDLIPGGACPANTTTPVYGRVRCDQDTSFSTFQGSGTPLDPDLKPFKQREITFTFQRQLTKNYLFSARYSRKDVIDAVEDAAFPTAANSDTFAYVIGNPGEGLIKQLADNLGVLAPKAQRQYDALEFRVDRRFANNYFFSVNYTFSRLYGNYSGTGSSDEEGRLEPNIERYFDSPGAGFTAAGGPDNGRLPTDRPHVLKAFGTYSLNWNRFLPKSNSTDFEVFFTASSGSVLTSFVQINGVEQVVLYKRGDLGRTPAFTQTDFALRHSIKFGRDGRFKLRFDADVINLFNEYALQSTGISNLGALYEAGNIISSTDFTPINSPTTSTGAPNPNYLGLITGAQYNSSAATGNFLPCWGAGYLAFQTGGSQAIINAVQSGGFAPRNPYYNVPTSYQTKRTVRYGVRLFF